MKKAVGFTYKAKKEDLDRATKCMDMLGVKYDLYNIPQFRAEGHIHNGQTVFVFGSTAQLAAETYVKDKKIDARIVILPHLKDLRPLGTNKETRDKTRLILEAESDVLTSQVTEVEESEVCIDDLPDLTHHHLLMLKKMVEERGDDTCLQVSRNGKKILIGARPVEAIEYDMFISFEELYTIRQAMDVLGVERVNVVSNFKSTPNRSR